MEAVERLQFSELDSFKSLNCKMEAEAEAAKWHENPPLPRPNSLTARQEKKEEGNATKPSTIFFIGVADGRELTVA